MNKTEVKQQRHIVELHSFITDTSAFFAELDISLVSYAIHNVITTDTTHILPALLTFSPVLSYI